MFKGLSAVRLAPTSASRGAVRRLATSMGQVQEAIEAKLTRALQPEALVVQNDSHKHNVPPNSETHFTVTVVSREFEGAKLLARHRMVNGLLKEELANGVHALSLTTRTPEEWNKNDSLGETPNCMGGSKR